MHRFVFILLLFGAFFGCSSDSKEKKEDTISTEQIVKKRAELFYRSLCWKFLEDAAKYCDKETQSILREMEHADYFISGYFKAVDTCVVDGNRAFCDCTDSTIYDSHRSVRIELRKYEVQSEAIWLVHYVPGLDEENPFLYDISLVEMEDFPNTIELQLGDSATPSLMKVVEGVMQMANSNDLVIGFTEQQRFWSSQVSKEVTSSFYSIDYFTVKANFNFNFDDLLTSYDVRITNIETASIFPVYGWLAVAIAAQLGKPYNANDIPMAQLYQYHSLKWFIKGHNEEVRLINNGDYISLEVNSIH